MGTHPIFESDFDCLTDTSVRKMSEEDPGTGSQSELDEIDEIQDDKQLESRRQHLQTVMGIIEENFTKSKHKLYLERKSLYEIKIKQLKENPDSNAELATGIAELMNEVKSRKEVASKLKEHQIKSITNWFEAEQQRIKQTLDYQKEQEKNKLRNKIKNKMEELQDSLRQKRHRHQPLFYFPYANRQKNSHSKVRKDQMVIYQIKPDLIEEDWNYIRKQTRNQSL